MACRTKYYMTRYLFWVVLWIAPARNHEGITLDVDKFLYHMCGKLGLRFVYIHHMRNVHFTSILPFRMFHVPNSCKDCCLLWCKFVNRVAKEMMAVRSTCFVLDFIGNKQGE